jgi:AcrR family transcriptional regulator
MSEGSRRAEILETAARLFAISGVRTSLKDIANACSILPGSIYYHFESKDAIIVELVQRYQADLDRLARDAVGALRQGNPGPFEDPEPFENRVISFGEAIAACAVRHPAALLMTLFEPPTGASHELRQLVLQTPTAIHDAMLALLRSHPGDAIRRSIDLAMLGDRLCESMMRHGVADSHLGPPALRLPGLRCRILLHGLAVEPPVAAALDRSDALRSAMTVAANWRRSADDDERTAHLLSTARTEFARRGFEVATLREIAAAAGLSVGAVYRLFPSKTKMFAAIMLGFEEQRAAAWDAVLRSSSTPLEKLDALAWLHIKLQERFGDEIRIQFSRVRESPLSTRQIAPASRLQDLEALLAAGIEANTIRRQEVALSLYARCVYEALWTPELVLAAGAPQAHALARDTVLAGALTPS